MNGEKMKISKISLGSIGNGVAGELFDREMSAILANIVDVNTPAKKVRKLVLEFQIRPDESRQVMGVDVLCTTKMPGVKPQPTTLFMGKENGKPVAFHQDPRQGVLDLKPREDRAPEVGNA